MDTDKLKTAILNGSWGNVLAMNDNFYRLLFKLEKKSVLKTDDTNELFASYQVWVSQIEKMVSECKGNDTAEDRKAVLYSEALMDDIIRHIENIITTVKCEDGALLNKLAEIADDATKMQ